MISAKMSCPPDWQREYYGYLMGPETTTNYICIVLHSYPDMCGQRPRMCTRSYHDNPVSNNPHHVEAICDVEAMCDGLACPPYDQEKEVTFVVRSN